MAAATLVNGKTTSNMVQLSLKMLKELKRIKFGKMASLFHEALKL